MCKSMKVSEFAFKAAFPAEKSKCLSPRLPLVVATDGLDGCVVSCSWERMQMSQVDQFTAA